MNTRLKVIFVLNIFLLSFFQTFSQNAEVPSFTLEDCIDYALKNGIDIRNSKIDAQIAKAQVGEIRAAGFPQIDGSVQLAHNAPLRRMFFIATPENPILGNDPALATIPEGSVIALQNFFQLPSSGDAGLNINQLIFNGSFIVGLRAAKTYQELASKTIDQTRIQTVEQVTKAYYTVLINNERRQLFEGNIARVDSLLRNTRGLFQNGFAEKIDVDRVQVSLNNLMVEREKFNDLVKLSIELLKFQMNYPMNQDLEIIGDARDLRVDENIGEMVENFNYTDRIEFSILQTQEALQKLDIQNNTSGYLPNLSAFANIGYFTQSPYIKGLFRTETSGLPENNFIGPDKWYKYGMFGLTLNVPIFDGLTKSYRVQQARLNLLKVQNGFELLRSSMDLQINQARINLSNSLKALNAQQENVELAEEVARVTKIKYTEGVGSNLEVTEAETALREAQINYYNVLYDAVISQIDLKTALGGLSK
ncbi:TolC family protein [soil metagenome]